MTPKRPVEQLDNSLLAERTRAVLLDAIIEDRFRDKLPNEPELAAMLNVSRTTLRVALQSLEQDGFITRRRAIGTTINRHVSPATLAVQRLVGFEKLLLEGKGGREVAIEDASWDRGQVPALFARVFDLSPEAECMLCDKKYVLDGSVALWVRDVVPIENLTSDIDGVELADLPASLLTFSDRYCVKPVQHAVAQMTASLATDDGVTATALAIPAGRAFVQLRERFFAADATAIAYGILDIDDTVAKIEIYRHRV
jgi:GntR family transcriptional regulator